MELLDKWSNRRLKHNEITQLIDDVENIYRESGIRLNKSSQLVKLLESSRKVSEDWANGNTSLTDMRLLFNTLHVERIASAVRPLKTENKKNWYLKRLLNGTVDFFERKPSMAKSILWELEVLAKIKKTIDEAYLEEPDVVVRMSNTRIAIPCKKIFSERGVPKVLSDAVKQIEKEHEFGIIAINIDDLIPKDSVLNAGTFQELGERLNDKNMEFFARHQRNLLKYFTASRIIAVIASTGVVADIHEESPKFNNASQWTIWTVPNIGAQHRATIEEFRDKIMA